MTEHTRLPQVAAARQLFKGDPAKEGVEPNSVGDDAFGSGAKILPQQETEASELKVGAEQPRCAAQGDQVIAATHATERTLTCLTGLTVGAGIAARTAMLGIPEDPNVGTILRRAHEHGLFTISLCHGPGSFLATALEGNEFLYSGYNMAIFPDSVDKKTPMIGYLPGHMPWRLGEKLTALGVKIVNTKSDKTCCLDRHLITGASPLAADALGKLAATTLLEHLI